MTHHTATVYTNTATVRASSNMVCLRASQLGLDMYVGANAILGLHFNSAQENLQYGMKQKTSRSAPVSVDPQLVRNLGV